MTEHDRLLELAGRYADGAATAAEVQELQAALRADPVLRRQFLRYLNVDAALTAMPRPRGAGLPPAPGLAARARWPGAAAAVLLLAGGLWWVVTRPEHSAESPAAPPVVLLAATNARWADPDVELALRSGDMPGEVLRLEAGTAEFRFTDGATAVVLGPAALRFPSRKEMFLQEGKVLCRCPTPASRITLATPATQVEDLGTEFAVEVAPTRQATRVAVLSGSVRVGTGETCVLQAGEAAEVGQDRVVRLTPLADAAFADLLRADGTRPQAVARGENLLADAAFAFSQAPNPWRATDGHVTSVAGQDAVAVHARGHRFWPGLRQTVPLARADGRLVVATVEALTPVPDPLRERQSALLKLVFLDERGREFANASRHFLQPTNLAGQYVATQVAAYAPAGTAAVQVQLLLNARGRSSGTVWFHAPRLVIAD